MHRSIVSLLAAITLLSSCLAPVTGCTEALAVVHDVATVIAKVTGYVNTIESKVQESGLLPPDVAQRLTNLRAAINRINDAAQLGPGAYEAAVAEFERLYAELAAVTAPFGVRTAAKDGRLGAPAPGTVQVATAGELGAELRAEMARQ